MGKRRKKRMASVVAFISNRVFVDVLIVILCAVPIFLCLGQSTVRLWDESRLGVNVLEMLSNKNYFIPHYDYAVDMWNTKPPLLIWIQLFFMKVFGYSEFALRLPSALATFFLAIFLLLFGKLYLKDNKIGWFSALIVCCSSGYIGQHITRTGDYDSLVTFLSFIYAIFYFKYLEDFKGRYLIWVALFMPLAFLTKSLAGLFLLPGMFIYTVIKKKTSLVFESYKIYLAIIFILLVILGYFGLREHFNPGYIKAVIENNFISRFLKCSTKETSFLYYFEVMRTSRFTPWFYFIPISFFFGFIQKDERIKNVSIYCLTLVVTHLVVISLFQSKFVWYDSFIYPFAAILVAIGLKHIYEGSLKYLGKNKKIKLVFFIVFISTIFLPSYERCLRVVYNPSFNDRYGVGRLEERYGYYFRYLRDERSQFKKFTVFIPEKYNASLLFYVKKFNLEGYDIKRKYVQESLEANELVVIDNNVYDNFIVNDYDFEVVNSWYEFKTVKIISKKIEQVETVIVIEEIEEKEEIEKVQDEEKTVKTE